MESDDTAVLIGVSRYQDPSLPDVPAALNSLHAMHRLLTDPDLGGWSEERVFVLEDPVGAAESALRLHRLAEETTGTLLLYFVGHGTVTRTGELCLATGDTQIRYPDLTGLEYDKVRGALLESPAQVKLAILDCCYAGRAIRGLAGSEKDHLAEVTDIHGVYTLTAADRTAHVPPDQTAACTSFTGVFLDVVREGIPGAPRVLALSDIYPELKRALKTRGLPEPNQRGTDTVKAYPFSRNVAYAGGEGFRLVPQERVDFFFKILAAQPRHALTAVNLENLSDWPGVYLLHQGRNDAPEIVYVGKGDRSIAARLRDHLRKIDGRCHLDLDEFSFNYLKLDDDLDYVAPERLMISRLHDQGLSPAWNHNGFGNRDSGRMRDTIRIDSGNFDALYPIDLTRPLRTDGPALDLTAHELALHLKTELPYVFRFEHRRDALDSTRLTVPEGPLPADRAFRLLAAALGDQWQISALMGRVLMYLEQRRRYPSAVRYYAGEEVSDVIPDCHTLTP
ncbi:caspase family protein [Streptomyces sp. NPDC057623]|uniref:caspase, EACC1-associated type n=1 Tax=Streptomyces sp. NPDC057623 TaxID=3346187 RepID=UPI0036878CC0